MTIFAYEELWLDRLSRLARKAFGSLSVWLAAQGGESIAKRNVQNNFNTTIGAMVALREGSFIKVRCVL